MKRNARLASTAVALGTILMCSAQPAFAQDTAPITPPPTADTATEARSQYQQGTQSFKDKHYEEAALHFEAAASFRSNAVALYTAGLAWDLANKPERAADAYARALSVGGLDPKQTNLAKDRVAQLEKMLGTATVTAPDGWRVQLDTFTEVATPARIHGTAGVHSLSVRSPKGIERRDLTLEGGKVSALELKDAPKIEPKIEKPPPPPPTPAALPPRLQESFWTTRRAIGVGVAGVGFMSVVSGIILGLEANSARDAYNAGPTQASYDHAGSLQTWTNITFIAGAVLLAGGVALVVIPEKDEGKSVHVSAGPGGAMLTGSF